jgi:adenylylsulfate kinase
VERLAMRGVTARLLDPDVVRLAVLDGRHGSPAEEDLLHRALAYAGKLLSDAGVPVVIDATAPRRAWRELARELVADFAEVQLLCPRETCGDRERAVRWHLSGRRDAPVGGAAAMPDIAVDYEESLRPDLVVHTDVQHPWTAAEALVLLAQRLQARAAESHHAQRRVS